MNDVMVRVENLGKLYYIGTVKHKPGTFIQSVAATTSRTVRSLFDPRLARTGANEIQELWALQGVSFELRRGEVLGIIGQNGSGKSTLLKLISRVTAPTLGRIDLYGRVGSLLEVGTGFHPDLTGRENVYLNGAILGMKGAQIDKIFDEIVDFSGVEKFIDTPVKYYSSGMFVRLAFSVASHFDPEILILDEVLAVGDAAFQKKSLNKMEGAAKSGKTVLFVSHGLTSITRLCDRGLYLEDGRVVYSGNTTATVSEYLRRINKVDEERIRAETGKELPTFLDLRDSNKHRDGYTKNIIAWVSTHRLDGEPSAEFNTGDSIKIRVGYHVEEEFNAECQINFLDYAGIRVMQLHNTHSKCTINNLRGDGFIECVIHDLRLLAGNYIISPQIDEISGGKARWVDCIGDTIHIKVNLGNYLEGVGLSQGQVVFAQRSEWNVNGGQTDNP